MKIALIGATGLVGKAILLEALKRGHEVTGIARHLRREDIRDLDRPHFGIRPLELVDLRLGDVNNPDILGMQLAGHDAIISATKMSTADPHNLLRAAHKSGVQRLLVVGGAGTLEIQGQPYMHRLGHSVPRPLWQEMLAGKSYLEALRAEKTLEWTFFCPSGTLERQGAAGKYKMKATDAMLTHPDGSPVNIALADFAMAILDELAAPAYRQARVAVGY